MSAKRFFNSLITLAAALSMNAQDAVLGSFYVKFEEPSCQFSQMRAKGQNVAGSRRVDSRMLLPVDKNKALQAYAPAKYAYSMHVGEALDNCFRMDFENVADEAQNDALYRLLVERFGKENVEKVPQAVIMEAESGNMPNDPLLHLDVLTGGWHLNAIGFGKIYGKYSGNPDIKVAVVDNAVWGGHPDLQIKPENQYFAYIEEEGNSAPPSNISQTEQGESMYGNMGALWSHGTHCAGLVAAISNNNEGVASFASGVTLMGARGADNNPDSMSRSYECILWALDKGARVLSLSWGSYMPSEVEREIIENAVKDGVVVVAAAGNEDQDLPLYPASYEGVISVGSVDSDFQRSDFSNYGDWVKIYAPGGYLKNEEGEITNTSDMILSTTYCISQQYHLDGLTEVDGLFYDGKVGTSMATPLLASVVSLMLSVDPSLTPAEVTEILQSTATKVDGLPVDPASGVVNAAAAVEAVAQASVGVVPAVTLSVYPNPAADWAVVSCSEPIEQMRVMDLNGRLCNVNIDGQKVDVSHLIPGIYFIQIETISGVKTEKLVKR